MNIENLKEVNHLTEVLAKIQLAITDITEWLEDSKTHEKDCGGFPEAEVGYSFNISEYSDGSAPIANLMGCYVSVECCIAIREVLIEKAKTLVVRLKELGVEI